MYKESIPFISYEHFLGYLQKKKNKKKTTKKKKNKQM